MRDVPNGEASVSRLDYLLIACVVVAVALSIWYRVLTGNAMIGGL